MLANVTVEYLCVCVCVFVWLHAVFEGKLHSPKHGAFFYLLIRKFSFLSVVSYIFSGAVYLDTSEEFLMPVLEEGSPIN
jgi:hypothetical protein